MPGYRGQTFKQRAESLPHGDWSSAKDLLIAMAQAIDIIDTEIFITKQSVDQGDSAPPTAESPKANT